MTACDNGPSKHLARIDVPSSLESVDPSHTAASIGLHFQEVVDPVSGLVAYSVFAHDADGGLLDGEGLRTTSLPTVGGRGLFLAIAVVIATTTVATGMLLGAGGGLGAGACSTLVAGIAFLVIRSTVANRVVEEAVIGIRGLGLEIKNRSANGHVSSDFINLATVKDLVIAEGITYFDVFYYLAVRLHDSGANGCHRNAPLNMKLPFKRFAPKLPVLERVLHGLNAFILEEQQLARYSSHEVVGEDGTPSAGGSSSANSQDASSRTSCRQRCST
eukprot:TRINITY_DN43317_c0_g1_i1.p1 TRINITY_DN43317_c0_g1~~TRINITY_DN43317_c0_g1_i1.p1  ORF type:complete len:274 (+),score=41.91 TRINITY_DN43317_c0_g1_i1:195-1016(+)